MSTLKPLQLLQNKSLRLCLGYTKTTPLDVMHSEAGELPVNLRREQLCHRYVLKTMSRNEKLYKQICLLSIKDLQMRYWRYKNSPVLSVSFTEVSHLKPLIYIADKLPYFNANSEIISQNQPHVKFLQDYSNIPQSIVNEVFLDDISELFPSTYTLFTDGSKLNNEVGCAYFDPNSNKRKMFKLPAYSTVYTAELIAIHQAMVYSYTLDATDITIFSDSRSALDALYHWKLASANHLIINIAEALLNLKNQGKNIKFGWCKAHCGISNNETVDLLAKEACSSGEYLAIPLPPSDLKGWVKRKIMEKWQCKFENSDKGLFYKTMVPQVNHKVWFKDGYFGKRIVTIINRMRANHGICRSYLFRIGKLASPLCRRCDETEDFEHVVMVCPNYSKEREKFFNEISRYCAAPLYFKEIIFSNNIYVYSSLAEFIKQYNI
ncbi:uncharacterized protein [Rhodnius prolixus]|uniref:uncharacterized protein n=1 Tax=Rhodnius prolixus TaxID=13249 RepID=UPI003D1882A2